MPEENRKSKWIYVRWFAIRFLLVVYDIIAVNAACYLALLTRFYVAKQFHSAAAQYIEAYTGYAPYYTILCLVIFCCFSLYSGIWKYAGFNDLNRIVGANVVCFIVHIIGTLILLRGTPMVLQAVFIFYGLPYFTDGAVAFKGMGGIWVAAIIVVSINTGAYMAESVRGGIISIDPGQTEGAKAIGMTHVQTMVNVIMPQALRNIIPQIGNNFIINIKDTSVMFVIGFVEFFATHRNIVGVNLLYFPSAVIEMAGYLMLTLAASFLLRWLEKRLDGSDNYELVSTDSLAMSAGTYSHPSRKTPFDERSGEFDSGRPKGEY